MLNVNFPDCEPDAVKGMMATTQGQRDPELLDIADRLDTRGKAYYWIGVQRRFVRVMPKDYRRVLAAEARARTEGREPTFGELVGATSG